MDREKQVVVVANGTFAHPRRLLAILDAADLVVAADGGANWLAAQQRQPHVLVGDMDSVAPELLASLQEGRCRLVRHPPDKDETDTELALLEAVALGAERITVIGALGGRIDHELANIFLLTMPRLAPITVTIYDGRSYLCVVRDSIVIRGQAGDTISLLPLRGDAEGVTTTGLQYPLRGETLFFGPARGVSNVLLGPEARVSLKQGELLLVHTPANAPQGGSDEPGDLS